MNLMVIYLQQLFLLLFSHICLEIAKFKIKRETCFIRFDAFGKKNSNNKFYDTCISGIYLELSGNGSLHSFFTYLENKSSVLKHSLESNLDG